MIYKLIVSERAKLDRDRAFDWYRENYSTEFAARWYDGIAQAIESLTRDPQRCAKPHEHERFAFEVYDLRAWRVLVERDGGFHRGKSCHAILLPVPTDVQAVANAWRVV